jgi:hypothetical protein
MNLLVTHTQSSKSDDSYGDRVPSAVAKGLGGHLEAGRRLVPLVFVSINPGDNIPDNRWIETRLYNLLCCLVVFNICLEDSIQYLIRRQIILISLVRFELGRGGFLDNPIWDHLVFLVNRDNDELCPRLVGGVLVPSTFPFEVFAKDGQIRDIVRL